MAGAEPLGGRISRRSALRRGLVAGGVVWAAPVIMSVPAYAGEGGGGTKKGTLVPCTKYYAVRISEQGVQPLASSAVCADLTAFIRDHPDISFDFPPADKYPQLLASQPGFDWAIRLPEGPIPDPAYNSRLIMGFGSATGASCCPAHVGSNDREVLVPQCNTTPLSVVQLIYCSP
ncbi:MAG: hypothetical protein QOI55_488 [Actinomycetota bacterium]|nr:hypothetical protein [Actinomycetota bacterium]